MATSYQHIDRTYHGFQHDHPHRSAKILVERTVWGPTQRLSVEVLGHLPPPSDGDFGWGYSGGGPGRAAAAILGNALNMPTRRFWGADELEHGSRLRLAFRDDVLSQLCDEWRLRRGAVLRWVRGWYAEHELRDLPPAIAPLPPIHLEF